MPLPCGRDPLGSSLRAADDCGGKHLPGQAGDKCAMNWLWSGPCGGVAGGASKDSSWLGHGRDTAVRDPPPPTPIRREKYVSNVVPNCGGTAIINSQGM